MENIWLHLGLGSFHRAHQAHYFNELLKTGNNDWVIPLSRDKVTR